MTDDPPDFRRESAVDSAIPDDVIKKLARGETRWRGGVIPSGIVGGPPDHAAERILCAAIYVDDGFPHSTAYGHPATGLVFAGWRHADCFVLLQAWAEFLTGEERHACNLRDYTRAGRDPGALDEPQHAAMRRSIRGFDQGFLTSYGRYVSRKEAATIAHREGQIDHPVESLRSEHLYVVPSGTFPQEKKA